MLILTFLICCFSNNSFAQYYPASPANWLYPDGNVSASKKCYTKSGKQRVDSMAIKWSSPAISGDVQPLIGNIINNVKLSDDFLFAPNEIAAVIGDSLVILDAMGKTRSKLHVPNFVKGISVLLDTLQTGPSSQTMLPVIMGLETIESQDTFHTAKAYLAGYYSNFDSAVMLRTLTLDLNNYNPNFAASVKPVFGKITPNGYYVYATVNMSKPFVSDPIPLNAPYFRGIGAFNAGSRVSSFPMPVAPMDAATVYTIGTEVGFAQPSIMDYSGTTAIATPTYPTIGLDVRVPNTVGPYSLQSYASMPLIFLADISKPAIAEINLIDSLNNFVPTGTKTRVRPFYIDVRDGNNIGGDSIFVLVAEEYLGADSSQGTSRLTLCNKNMASPGGIDTLNSAPYYGGKNHFWSVAVGNLDGNASNEVLPYYPNNPGNEIIVSQSSRDFAYAGSKISILRYNTNPVPKSDLPNTFLNNFDTLCTANIFGWVAAINDIDGADDGKDEIIVVDGSNLTVYRMKDYSDLSFPGFDIVFQQNFKNETISAVEVADIEGDGLNDIIVTTYDSTYIIGTTIQKTIKVISPKVATNPIGEYCAGDSVAIKWVNIMKSEKYIDLLFQTYISGVPSGTLIPIASHLSNDNDTITYYYRANLPILGSEGKFLVRGINNSSLVYDTTTVLKFNAPSLTMDTLNSAGYQVGTIATFKGSSMCLDSIGFYYSFNDSTWTKLGSMTISGSGSFTRSVPIPCLGIFSCSNPSPDTSISIRYIAYRAFLSDTIKGGRMKLLPTSFPIIIDSNMTADPTKQFHWAKAKILFPCDSVSISVSSDNGRSFAYITTVATAEEKYSWLIPLQLPNTVLMRFCCENSCVRTDTLLGNIQPKYISIVAPNPFSPQHGEILEVVYKVPVVTNVTIRIYDQHDRIVAEPVKNQARKPETAYTDTWDGLIGSTGWAANGMYYLSLELSNGDKDVYPIFVRK